MTVKTDPKDALGLAQQIRMGWFRLVHAKSMGLNNASSSHYRALIPTSSCSAPVLRIDPCGVRHSDVSLGIGATGSHVPRKSLVELRAAGWRLLDKSVLALVREDAVCRRLMTVPGVGPLV
jgi:transposase